MNWKIIVDGKQILSKECHHRKDIGGSAFPGLVVDAYCTAVDFSGRLCFKETCPLRVKEEKDE